MGIRPETCMTSRISQGNADCIVKANIEVVERWAPKPTFTSIPRAITTARVEPTSTARPGDEIDIVIDNRKIHLFTRKPSVPFATNRQRAIWLRLPQTPVCGSLYVKTKSILAAECRRER